MSTPTSGTPDVAYEALVSQAREWIFGEANDGLNVAAHHPHSRVYDPKEDREIEAWKRDVRPGLVRRNATISAVGSLAAAVGALSIPLGSESALLIMCACFLWVAAGAFAIHILVSLLGKASPSGRPHVDRISIDVLPEVEAAIKLVLNAPVRLNELHASANVIAQVRAAGAVVEAELPRLRKHDPWRYGGQLTGAAKWTSPQLESASYARIMRAGAEVLLVLRLAEEKEHALVTGGSSYGPWGTRSLIGAVRELADEATLVHGMVHSGSDLDAIEAPSVEAS